MWFLLHSTSPDIYDCHSQLSFTILWFFPLIRVVGWVMAPRRHPCPDSRSLRMWPYMQKKGFVDMTELRMSRWGFMLEIWMGSKCDPMYLHTMEAERDFTLTEEEAAMGPQKQSLGRCRLGTSWAARRCKEQILPGTPRGAQPGQCFDLSPVIPNFWSDFWSPELWENILLCEAPECVGIVTAATGN